MEGLIFSELSTPQVVYENFLTNLLFPQSSTDTCNRKKKKQSAHFNTILFLSTPRLDRSREKETCILKREKNLKIPG